MMICSFIPIIFNNHPHLFVKLVHLLSFSPYAAPEKWAYHLPFSSTPNSPGKIAFSLIPHFRPLSYILHEKWGYHHLQTSTQSFPGNIGFLRGGKRVIYRTINGMKWMITTPPFYPSKLDWKFRVDIRRGRYNNKVCIRVCRLCIQSCGQVQFFFCEVFLDIVILNRGLTVVNHVHLFRNNIHSCHLMVLRKQGRNRQTNITGTSNRNL